VAWIAVKSMYGKNRETLIRVEDISCVKSDGSEKHPHAVIYLHGDQCVSTPETQQQVQEKIDRAEKAAQAEKLADRMQLVDAFAEALAERLKEPRRYTRREKPVQKPVSATQKAGRNGS